MWTKPELFRVLRIRLKDDPFGLQIKQGQPQGKRSGRRHAVVDEKQTPAHDPTGIDHDIIEAYTLRASERFGRGNSVGLSLAELADPDDPPVLAQEILQPFAPWRYLKVSINIDTDGARTKARYRLQRLCQHIIR
jgi:hypothetical protein